MLLKGIWKVYFLKYCSSDPHLVYSTDLHLREKDLLPEPSVAPSSHLPPLPPFCFITNYKLVTQINEVYTVFSQIMQ